MSKLIAVDPQRNVELWILGPSILSWAARLGRIKD